MATPTDRALTFDQVQDIGHGWSAEHEPRTPPGEAFAPYNPLLGEENPNAAWARFCHEQSGLAADMRAYLGMLSQRDAPQNEQVYQNAGTLLNGAALDLDLGQVPLNLVPRVHRIMLAGTPADVVSITLYRDGGGVAGSALATYNPGALNADGVSMVEPRDLNIPRGSRLIARVRAGVSVNPIYVTVFTRSYPA